LSPFTFSQQAHKFVEQSTKIVIFAAAAVVVMEKRVLQSSEGHRPINHSNLASLLH